MSAASCSCPSSTSGACWCGRAHPSPPAAVRLQTRSLTCCRAKAASPARLRRCKTPPSGPAKGWSDDIIDLAPLGLADADLALSVDRLVYKNVTTGRSRLNLALQDRVAKVTLEDVQLYSGRARGVLTLDGRAQTAATTTNLTLDGVSVLPLLSDALEFAWLDGRGTIALSLAGQGNSERQIVETLRGKVDLSVTRGRHHRPGHRPAARQPREGALLRAAQPIRRTRRPSASSAARSWSPTALPRTRI